MATEVWWVDPPRSALLGGYITYKYHDDEVAEVVTANNEYFSGFQCAKQWFFPADLVSDHYECWTYHFFTKFRLPTATSGVMQSAELYLMLAGANMVMNVNPIYMDIDVYYKGVYNADSYPWHMLDSGDYADGTWTQNSTSIENFYEMWGDFLVDGIHWIDPVDVTEGVQKAIDEEWVWVAFRFTPNYLVPLDYDWDERPTPYDQLIWLGFYGATNPYWVESPTGFPDTHCSPCPWLKITYSGGDTQYIPGEDVTTSGQGNDINSISADPKARMAIAGTEGGGLWYCWSGGGSWNKVYETASGQAITAVWMDIVRNFQDYPLDEIAWFGTDTGELYKSEDALATWKLIYTFPTYVREIMTPEDSSSKIVVGCDDGIWVSDNGGITWTLGLDAPTGVF